MTLIDDYRKIETPKMTDRGLALFDLLKDCKDIEALQEIGSLEGEYLRGRFSVASLGTQLSKAKYHKLFNSLELIQGENAVTVAKQDGSTVLQHAFLEKCSLTPEEWFERNESDRVSQRLENAHELQPAAILEKAEALIGSNDWREVAVGLLIATGRRPHEIVARAKFAAVAGDDWHVSFSGQGKKRGDKPEFQIATLLPAAACRSALNTLRRNHHLKSVIAEAKAAGDVVAQNAAIDSRTNKILNRTVVTELKDLIPIRKGDKNENCKSLRAAYLAMATERDCRGSIGQKMLHAAKLAGHVIEGEKLSDGDLAHIVTTLGYSDYFCSDVPFPKIIRAKPESIKAHVGDTAQIDAWKTLWGKTNREDTIAVVIELARKQLAVPAEAAAEAIEVPAEVSTTVTVTEDPEMNQATEARFAALESKFDHLVALLENSTAAVVVEVPATVPAEVPTAAVVVEVPTAEVPATAADPKPAAKAEKNAAAAASFEDMPIAELKTMKGYGVSFQVCHRVYQAVCNYNAQYPDPELMIALNKSLLRSVAGCNNSTAAEYLGYYAEDIATYHATIGIDNPEFHNRKHHQGSDFAAAITALVT
jgi:hypothetical protein